MYATHREQYWQQPEYNLVFRLHRPFFDLGPASPGSLASHGPLVAYAALDDEAIRFGVQRAMTDTFRFSLIAESGLRQYAAYSPLEVPPEFRTPAWQRLCDLTEGFAGLSVGMQIRVLRLLVALCFHRLVLQLVPASIVTNITCAETASLAYLRAFARYALHMDHWQHYRPDDMEEVIRRAPARSLVQHVAALNLLVYSAKVRRDLDGARRYRKIAELYLAQPHLDHDSFEYHLLWSRFYRGASFVPYLAGDREAVTRELGLAEEHARAVPVRTEVERIIATDNLYFALESRMREAIWLGDLDLAQARMEEIVALDPWDAKAHIELGEVLFRRGRLAEAATAYRRAALFSPPGTPIALFLAGYCSEQIGDLEEACEAYMRVLRVDPEGVSALAGLIRVARKTGQKPLQVWAEGIARQLIHSGRLTAAELQAEVEGGTGTTVARPVV